MLKRAQVINLATEQQDAVEQVVNWFNDLNGPQVAQLDGPAGSGKTTLIKHLTERIDGCRVAAYTHKAKSVLIAKGVSAETVYGMAYKCINPCVEEEKELSELRRQLRIGVSANEEREIFKRMRQLENIIANSRPVFKFDFLKFVKSGGANLIIIDECSMLSKEMMEELLKLGRKILGVGDIAQLPPVGNPIGYFTRRKPEFVLTETWRQLDDSSDILLLASDIRQGRPLRKVYGLHAEIVEQMPDRWATNIDYTVLCGLNKTRIELTKQIRAARGRVDIYPEIGERLVCLNNYDSEMTNGSLWDVVKVRVRVPYLDLTVRSCMTSEEMRVSAHREAFRSPLRKQWSQQAVHFYFGYVLTVHKAQGSEWDDVLVVTEDWGGCNKRWLYTGVTRAKREVTVVMENRLRRRFR